MEVGGWEHQCCGPSIERQEVVDLGYVRVAGPEGQVRFVESHHDTAPVERVRGRVADIQVAHDDGGTLPVLRVPGGRALRGFDPADDGHLEDPWTGEEVTSRHEVFFVLVRPSA
uniref:Uncharacterized protein n=1 Tax=uncultured Armatimonadetes bacterium TaxID=157466 RepID=A0A6J4IE98_9BACT|nr:hypothetical protein AVDCRST_MAG63-1807 [uncultured Armatimonadetes bacterium]